MCHVCGILRMTYDDWANARFLQVFMRVRVVDIEEIVYGRCVNMCGGCGDVSASPQAESPIMKTGNFL